jgi:hypothetical protein
MLGNHHTTYNRLSGYTNTCHMGSLYIDVIN